MFKSTDAKWKEIKTKYPYAKIRPFGVWSYVVTTGTEDIGQFSRSINRAISNAYKVIRYQ